MDEYTKNKELFLAQKQAEKDAYLNGVRDALERLPANPSEFSRYLTIQGRLPDYSVGNALSIVRYCPDARVVRLYANWEKLGYKPKVGMKGIPVSGPRHGVHPTGRYPWPPLRSAKGLRHFAPAKFPCDAPSAGGTVYCCGDLWNIRPAAGSTSVKDGPDAQYDPSTNTISIRGSSQSNICFRRWLVKSPLRIL